MSAEAEIRRAGARYHAARRRQATELDRIAGLLLDNRDLSVNGAAVDTDLPRSTIIRRMDAIRARREEAARAALPNITNPDAPARQPADTDR